MLYPLKPHTVDAIVEVEEAAKACVRRSIEHGAIHVEPSELIRLKRAMLDLLNNGLLQAIAVCFVLMTTACESFDPDTDPWCRRYIYAARTSLDSTMVYLKHPDCAPVDKCKRSYTNSRGQTICLER